MTATPFGRDSKRLPTGQNWTMPMTYLPAPRTSPGHREASFKLSINQSLFAGDGLGSICECCHLQARQRCRSLARDWATPFAGTCSRPQRPRLHRMTTCPPDGTSTSYCPSHHLLLTHGHQWKPVTQGCAVLYEHMARGAYTGPLHACLISVLWCMLFWRCCSQDAVLKNLSTGQPRRAWITSTCAAPSGSRSCPRRFSSPVQCFPPGSRATIGSTRAGPGEWVPTSVSSLPRARPDLAACWSWAAPHWSRPWPGSGVSCWQDLVMCKWEAASCRPQGRHFQAQHTPSRSWAGWSGLM